MGLSGGTRLAASDGTLVLRALEGDQQAFGELYDRYAALVRAICKDSTGDFTRAQDLAQEVFLRAYAKLADLRDRERFGPWLVSIARFVGREFRRGAYRDRHVLVGLAPEETPSELPKEDERLGELAFAMARLSERERLALNAYYLQEQNAAQASKTVGVSRSTLYRLLAEAREKLERFIEEREEKK